MRAILAVLLVAVGAASAGELLEPEKSNPRARRLREEAFAKLEPVAATLDLVRTKKDVEPAAALAATRAIEEAMRIFERALGVEWNQQANQALGDAARAWYYLRPKLPPPEKPADGEAKKKQEAAEASAHRERLRDARRFLLDTLKARKFQEQFRRCSRCDGRGKLSDPFAQRGSKNEKRRSSLECPVCGGTGMRRDEKGILQAIWLCYSPLYRADPRNLSNVHRKLLQAARRPETLAPWVRTASIEGSIEDHDLWVRIHTKEKIQETPGARKTKTVENSYVLFRVGDLWFLHTPRFDRDLVEVPEEEAKPQDGK